MRANDHQALQEALREYRAARLAWAGLANVAAGVYRDDVTYGPVYYQRGHWLDRLAAMDEDIADIEKLLNQPPSDDASKVDWKKLKSAMREASQSKLSWKSSEHTHPSLNEFHTTPTTFRRGEALTLNIQVSTLNGLGKIAGVQLRYRRVNQGEIWQGIEMEKVSDEFKTAIPASYTDSPFPLQYYFRIRNASGDAVLRPGLETRFKGQPYFVVRQA